jgi:urease accessory protein
MLELRERLAGPLPDGRVAGELVLPFELRQRSRLRARLASGEDVALLLPRGTVLRNGDLLQADDGRTVRVSAQAERVMHVECDSSLSLLRAAYHLGNRHVPLQIEPGWLRLAEDHVLGQMLARMGARVTLIDAPFEPEAGAYGDGAVRGHDHHAGARLHDHAHDHHDHAD